MELESGSITAAASPRARVVQGLLQQRQVLRREAIACIALVLIAAANGLLWFFTVPFQKGPDEAAHLQVVRFILDYGRLPVFSPDELWLIKVPEGVVETYATFPPLAYLAMAATAWALPVDLMWGARLVSLLSYLAAVIFVFLIGRRLFPNSRRIAICAVLVVALWPQFAFVGAYANNDELAVLESAALYYLLIVWWQRGSAAITPSLTLPPQGGGDPSHPPPFRRRVGAGGPLPRPPLRGRVGEGGILLGIGALAGALLLTKYPFYAIAALALALPVAMALLLRSGRLWAALLSPLAGAALVSAWWFVRNWLLYQELLPGKVVGAAKAAAGGNTLFVPVDAGFNLLTLSTETNFWQITLQSFVAGLGLLDIFLPSGWYLVCAALGLLAAIGLVFGLRRAPPGRAGWMLLLASAVALAGTTLSAMVISLHGEYAPHGRYFFPMLIPLALGLSAGWTWLARVHVGLRWVPIAAVTTLVVLNAVSLLGYVVPAYYGQGSPSVTVQIDRPSAPQPSDAQIEVSGWSFIEGGEPWRPYTADLVARYRRPMSDLAVYVDGPPGEGGFQGGAESGLLRPDVSQLYGGLRELERVGYRLLLAPGSVLPGEHRVYVCAGMPVAPTCSSRPFRVV